MSLDRNAVFGALEVLLQNVAGLNYDGRRLKDWSNISVFPAMFLRSGDDIYEKREIRGLPALVMMEGEVWIFYKTVNPDEAPGTTLDTLIQAVEKGVEPNFAVSDVQTLGGLVEHCWIEGKVEKAVDDLGGSAIAMIPVKILTTSNGPN